MPLARKDNRRHNAGFDVRQHIYIYIYIYIYILIYLHMSRLNMNSYVNESHRKNESETVEDTIGSLRATSYVPIIGPTCLLSL